MSERRLVETGSTTSSNVSLRFVVWAVWAPGPGRRRGRSRVAAVAVAYREFKLQELFFTIYVPWAYTLKKPHSNLSIFNFGV